MDQEIEGLYQEKVTGELCVNKIKVIRREREREGGRVIMSEYINVYIYIYIYVCMQSGNGKCQGIGNFGKLNETMFKT